MPSVDTITTRSGCWVSAFTSADLPKIAALKPDLVLAFSDLQAEIVRELIATGYNVMTWNQRSVAEILAMIVMLGALVGKGHEADDGDAGSADVVVFKVADHIFIACNHGEGLDPAAQQGMLTLLQTAQAP